MQHTLGIAGVELMSAVAANAMCVIALLLHFGRGVAIPVMTGAVAALIENRLRTRA